MASSSHRYKAFISYSRQDAAFAKNLHRRLENYVLPVATRAQVDGRPRRPLKPVFRDEGELVPGGSLPDRLRDAVADSEALVLICSPDAARREWVDKEVRFFLASHPADKLICVVKSGTPGASRGGGDPVQECFPSALLELVDEPLWLDASKTRRLSRINLLRLIAAICGLRSVDELIRRDDSRRRARFVWLAATALLLLLVMVGGWWFTQRDAAIQQADNLERLAEAAGDAGEHDRAGRLLLRSTALRRQYLADPVTPTGEALMRRTIMMSHLRFSYRGRANGMVYWKWINRNRTLEFQAGRERLRFTPDNDRLRRVTRPPGIGSEEWDRFYEESEYSDLGSPAPDGRRYADASNGALTIKRRDGAAIRRLSIPVREAAFAPDSRHVLAYGGYDATGFDVWIIDTTSGSVKARAKLPSKDAFAHDVGTPSSTVPVPHFTRDGRQVALCSMTDCRAWRLSDGREVMAFHRDSVDTTMPEVSPTGDLLALQEGQFVQVSDFRSGVRLLKVHVGEIGGFDFSPDGEMLVTSDRLGELRVWKIGARPRIAALYRPEELDGDNPPQVELAGDGIGLLGLGTISPQSLRYATFGGPMREVVLGTDGALSFFATARAGLIGMVGPGGTAIANWTAAGQQSVLRTDPGASGSTTPRGDFIVLRSGEGPSARVRVDTLTGETVYRGPGAGVTFWDVAPDGRRALMSSGTILRVIELPSGRVLWQRRLRGTPRNAALQWSTGHIVALPVAEDSGSPDLFIASGTREFNAPLEWDTGYPGILLSADGAMVAITHQASPHLPSAPVELWSTTTGESLGTLSAPIGEQNARGAILLSTGNFILSYNEDAISIWDRRTMLRIAWLISPTYLHEVKLIHGRLIALGGTGVALEQMLPKALAIPKSKLSRAICRSTLHPLQRTITADDAKFAPALSAQIGVSVCLEKMLE